MAVDNPVKVTRYGRHERTMRTYPAASACEAGDVVTLSQGEVSPAGAGVTQDDQLLIAVDDRERGKELGDTYSAGESVHVVAPSGGAFNLLLADGQTVDPTAEERLAVDGDGKLRPFDSANDADNIALFFYDGDGSVSASGSFEKIPTTVL